MESLKPELRTAAWSAALKESVDPARVRHYLRLLSETSALEELCRATPEQAQTVSAVCSGSQALSASLVAHPDWISLLAPEQIQHGRRKQGLQQERDSWLKPLIQKGDFATALARTRQFKAREMLRIGARDLARRGTVEEIIGEISDVADVCLDAVWESCYLQLAARYGEPYFQDASGRWRRSTCCVLGMGKLGGRELNYSSDVDVLFVYDEEGHVFTKPPAPNSPSKASATAKARAVGRKAREGIGGGQRAGLSNHQFFNRLAEAFIAEVSRLAPEGTLYRIDLRLRPEGDLGPLTRSMSSYETYYAQWGQTWERMMLIKARGVAGDQRLAAEFLETIQPFRYPRLIGENVLAEVGAMKDRIENEVVAADAIDRNVKLGRGGIREIEFTAQALQLLHGGRQPFLQGSQTLPALEKLARYELISSRSWRELRDAYRFLRNVEHRLQMENDQQTHTIPADKPAQQRLARLMGFDDSKLFEQARRDHARRVREVFEFVLKREVPQALSKSPLPLQFEGAEAEWKKVLEQCGFKEPGRAVSVLREFVEGPGYVHVSARTNELAYRLIPRILKWCPGNLEPAAPSTSGFPAANLGLSHKEPANLTSQRLSDPDRVVTRLDNYIAAYGARSTLFELWNGNPAFFELLLLLFDRSEFLAELAIRSPDLVDELVSSGRLRQRKSAEETLRDLRHGLNDKDQLLWLRRYHQAEVMRIGLRDILGLADEEQYLTELSALADACLRYALESTLHKHRLKTPPFVIIGLGKLGGAEIDYGSDLDILFVAPSKAKDPGKLRVLAIEILELLSTRTEQGLVFHTDARLRPDGEKGLLVNTLAAYQEYYRKRGALWEIQTLTRMRVIAGDGRVGEAFQIMARELTNFARPSLPLAAFAPDWKQKIHQMRMRIEKERTAPGQDELAIKTGSGGLMDAEFIAQVLCLEYGWQEANTLKALQRGRDNGVLPDAQKLIVNYRWLRRIEGTLRRWSYEGETALPVDPAPYSRV
ncbi:MAG TPA: hypothetical protein VKY92_18105, partial [Verrucomicrobiae bacterium]|nr:hypothetical protein [Verrucomicrobiae bacterium]